jgi:hypothetical protein
MARIDWNMWLQLSRLEAGANSIPPFVTGNELAMLRGLGECVSVVTLPDSVMSPGSSTVRVSARPNYGASPPGRPLELLDGMEGTWNLETSGEQVNNNKRVA